MNIVRQSVKLPCLTLVVLLLAVHSYGIAAADGPTKKIATIEQLRAERTKAAHRPRRIIFNNDGDDVYRCKEATPESLLECRTTALLGSQVDSIFYSTSGCFSRFSHNTKVGEVNLSRGGGYSNNHMEEFLRQGTDPLRIMIDFCRKNRLEIVWSMRMNDTHDGGHGPTSPYQFPQLKKDHPEWLIADKSHHPRMGRWTAVNYARPEIRELALAFFREVCDNYDVDGIELDFFRHLINFKSHSMGKEVGRQERDMMTDLVRKIRQMTETVGLKRGRPILVGVRVPDSVEACRVVGLDLDRWLQEGLIDMMTVSGYFQFNPWETSVELGHKYGVVVFPCLSGSQIVKDTEGMKVRKSLACYRARAMEAWNSGADGVYVFNVFDPKHPLWRELGDPKALETLDKMYCVNVLGTRVINRFIPNGQKFFNRSDLSPDRPLSLQPDKPVAVTLTVGEKVRSHEDRRLVPQARLRLRVDGVAGKTDGLSVSLNGKPLSEAALSGVYLIYPVQPELIRKGANHVTIMLKPGNGAGAKVQDLMLSVEYKTYSILHDEYRN